jgi:hypothetical protein
MSSIKQQIAIYTGARSLGQRFIVRGLTMGSVK